MGKLTIYREEATAFTAVSNCFIDNYMADANDAQLKVYLYLLRMFQANQATGISDMADLFNHTEKDILRALKYWEKKRLLALEFDAAKNLSAIRLLTAKSENASAAFHADIPQTESTPQLVALPSMKQTQHSVSSATTPAAKSVPAKVTYTPDELKAFKDNEEISRLLFIAQQYIGKPLSPTEVNTLLFIYDKLHFSFDLVDYLIQYCIDRDKRGFHYIQSVAINWAENNITSPEEAKNFVFKYDKTVYSIMKSLGKNTAPAPIEIDYIMRWTKEWNFSLPVIKIACERAVIAVDTNRFKYVDKVLKEWNRSNIHNIEDIRSADAAHQKSRSAQSRSSVINNQFNQFPQRDYDFDALEKELLSN